MRPTALVVVLSLLAGCNSPSPPGAPGAGKAKPLTEEEKAAWKKYTREKCQVEGKCRVAMALLREKYRREQYQAVENGWRTWDNRYRLFIYGGGGTPEDREEETRLAKESAAHSFYKAVAIVEYGPDEPPHAVLWYYDDDDGMKVLKDAPTPEMASSLAEYFVEMQRRAPFIPKPLPCAHP